MSMRSRRTRWWPSAAMGDCLAVALVRTAKASEGVRRPRARWWSHGVVVGGEAVQLGLELGEVAGGVLAGQMLLQRLVEPLHLAAGLGVVGPGVPVGHAQPGRLVFHGAAAVARPSGEDGAVVGQHVGKTPC